MTCVFIHVFVSRHRLLAADMMTCRDLEEEMGKPVWSQWPVAHPLPLQGPTQTPSWCQSAGNGHNHHRWLTFHVVHLCHGMKEGNFYFFGLFWTSSFNVYLWYYENLDDSISLLFQLVISFCFSEANEREAGERSVTLRTGSWPHQEPVCESPLSFLGRHCM